MPLTADQRAMSEELWPAIKAYAKRKARGTRDGEEIAGEVLVEAVRVYDPVFGLEPLEHAKLAVQNAINNHRKREWWEVKKGLQGGAPTNRRLNEGAAQGRHVDRRKEKQTFASYTDTMKFLPDTTAGHTWHALLHGVLDKMARDRVRAAAFMSWIVGWSAEAIAEHLGLKRAWVYRLLGEARSRARAIIEHYGEAALTPNNVPWPEPTTEEHDAYAWYLSNCEDLRQCWSISIPLDSWLGQGQPTPSAAKDLSDELYRRIGTVNYARARRHSLSGAA